MPVPTFIVVIAITGTLNSIRLYKENRRLNRQVAALVALVGSNIEYIAYMSDVLDRSGVEISEFDKIAINQIIVKMKGSP